MALDLAQPPERIETSWDQSASQSTATLKQDRPVIDRRAAGNIKVRDAKITSAK
jgi:hypothetical protein